MNTDEWLPNMGKTGQPKYIEMAIAIGEDIASGRLEPGDRLPPQRKVAKALDVDISLISRAYTEAARRGFVESHVGRGTFVAEKKSEKRGPDPRRTLEEDPRMNMPPEIESSKLVERMRHGFDHVASNIIPLLRYQSATGGVKDREIAIKWLQTKRVPVSTDTLTITPGTHSAIHAALTVLKKPQTVILCEPITYPGIRAIASYLSISLLALEEDERGITPSSLGKAINEHPDAVLYLNPTVRNPTTHTMPGDRRVEIADVLRRHNIPLIEDDAYGLVVADTPTAISDLVPELAWHILGVSKAFGASLRLAYARAPNRDQLSAFVQIIRTINVMTSPLNLALLSTWIEDGTADDMLVEVRDLADRRQAIAHRVLEGFEFDSQKEAYNIWLKAPEGLSRAEIMARLAGGPLAVMPSDVFTVAGSPEERLRVCLGGPISEAALEDGLTGLRSVLRQNDWTG
ncbi:MAG: PLP-dependent aminotransferase family protein [Ahrensia sp.]|nr:PLP-dependent aminotransferase family protein [Ahrensia sp.]